MSEMSITYLNDIRPNQYVGRIRIRVARAWRPKKFKSEFFDGLHYLLIDERADTMHAIVAENDYEYTTKLEEGCMYDIYHVFTKKHVFGYKVVDRDLQLTFNQPTKSIPLKQDTCSIPRYAFQFLQFEQVEDRFKEHAEKDKQKKEQIVLIDIYGCIKDVQSERKRYIPSTDEHESICVVTLENLRRQRVIVTLWGHHARSFDLKVLEDPTTSVFVAFTSLNLKKFRDYITPTSTNHTCIIYNPQLPDSAEYETEFNKPGDKPIISAPYKQRKKDETWKTIFDLYTLDPEAYKDQIVVCCATIIRFSTHSGWWYNSCSEPNCNKQLKQHGDDGTYECQKHNVVKRAFPCYRVYLTIEDDKEDQITLTLMGQQAEQLFGYTCSELLEKRNYAGNHDLPEEIAAKRGNKYLFDLQVKLDREITVKGIQPNPDNDEPISATPQKTYEKKRAANLIGKSIDTPEKDKKTKRQGKEATPSLTEKKQTEKDKRE
ncbi:uncharacterized protein LOC126788028 isoform X2 [Argentina anserina]|nr:uncharacterized protein LOC126788028 isoform X2 [Potentilla anserina]XP_050369954.1 uncharacterized protein LOC126788028 isoform X2 [Potentilla anserina]XP_050369962.1 uncharacterized protein LOC126788028 isoform X2 [Potentilla anserina]XP_050369971.1 uncharacterized protein LOC126788028 isoform X2 [Potentilla anserina]XP_050369977.1 uncharacterized protein LOC126788028 isoform X2 [Potentilla anserina]XP_050369985.1 uncharacterized protein LOC126788028 isoform X2 [Potentilla anserina]XP_05